MDTNKVLDAWIFLETIQPSELPNGKKLNGKQFSDGESRKTINRINFFQKIYEKAKPKNPKKHRIQYTFYMNGYKLVDLIEVFRTYYKNNEEVINRPMQECYSFSFKINDEGEYIEDSLFIPHLHSIIFDIQQKGKIDYDKFTERHDDACSQFEKDLKTIFSNGITQEATKQLSHKFYDYFDEPSHKTYRHYFEINLIKNEDSKDIPDFNSFYIDDLHTIKQNNMNQTLKQFITGKQLTTDIDRDEEAIESLLSPMHISDGRWPSRIDHRLTLMQQVAVNQIINGNELIHSVNGPPGTGKTTLLQDIFAHLIVERAKQMVAYKNPTKAFNVIGKFRANSNEFERNMYELNQDIAKYSMVVTSSNNGAVENISKELPEVDKIIRPIKEELDKKEEKRKLRINEAEKSFAEEAKSINLFIKTSDELLINKKSWGLFSVALGKRSNIESVAEIIKKVDYNKTEGNPQYLLELLSEPLAEGAWEEAVKEFRLQLQTVTSLKENLEAFKNECKQFSHLNAEQLYEKRKSLQQEIKQFNDKYKQLQEEKELIREQISLQTPTTFLQKVKSVFKKRNNETINQLKEESYRLIEQQKNLISEKEKNIKEIEHIESDLKKLDGFLEKMKQFADEELVIPDEAFWSEEQYEYRQQNVPWQTDSLNIARSMLFLKALKVHKIFLMKNYKPIKNAIYLFTNLKKVNVNVAEQKSYLAQMWKTMHLIFPVQSTTFASFSSMYKGMGQDFIDYLFIDEAGQASPQAAAGALWRSKKAIVVGDPIQIEPVVTLDDTVLEDVKQSFQVTDRYVGSSASVQVLADYANPIGTYKDNNEEVGKERIGIPLWVHRRCLDPMFSIANEMAYDGKMVLANKEEEGKSAWFNCIGKVTEKQYVQAQGDFMVNKIKEHFERVEEGALPNVFIITPFTAVKSQLSSLIRNSLQDTYPQIKAWVRKSIGTVHTFQGKEADIVYFVIGTDETTDSAANWSCQQPNLLNVAVTRAKKEFYMIGDEQRFKTKQFYDVIHRYIK